MAIATVQHLHPQIAERIAELRVAIYEQVAFAIEKAVFTVGSLSRDLLHPIFVGEVKYSAYHLIQLIPDDPTIRQCAFQNDDSLPCQMRAVFDDQVFKRFQTLDGVQCLAR